MMAVRRETHIGHLGQQAPDSIAADANGSLNDSGLGERVGQ